MKKLTIKQQSIRDFRKFLADNDALQEWTKNAKAYQKNHNHTIAHIFTEREAKHYLLAAFDWLKSPEGSSYWIKLDVKWNNQLNLSK